MVESEEPIVRAEGAEAQGVGKQAALALVVAEKAQRAAVLRHVQKCVADGGDVLVGGGVVAADGRAVFVKDDARRRNGDGDVHPRSAVGDEGVEVPCKGGVVHARVLGVEVAALLRRIGKVQIQKAQADGIAGDGRACDVAPLAAARVARPKGDGQPLRTGGKGGHGHVKILVARGRDLKGLAVNGRLLLRRVAAVFGRDLQGRVGRAGGNYARGGVRIEIEQGHRARAEKFPYEAQQHERQGEAQPHAQTVQHGVAHAVLRSKGFGTGENYAVDDDERQINAERVVQRGYEFAQQHLHHSDECGDDEDIRGDTHPVGNDLAQQRHQQVGTHQHYGGGNAHAQSVERARRNGESGTHPQHQTEDGVGRENAVGDNPALAFGVESQSLAHILPSATQVFHA